MNGMILTKAGLLAIPGLLIFIAWRFWDKDRLSARLSLALGIAVTLVAFIFVAGQNEDHPIVKNLFKKQEYKIVLSPSPQDEGWGGIYEDGRSIEKVEAILLSDKKEKHRNTVTFKNLEIENRELKAKSYPRADDRMFIKMNKHLQGYVLYDNLGDDLLERIWTRDPPSFAIALTDEFRNVGQKGKVHHMSAVKGQFDNFQMEVVAWNYKKPGSSEEDGVTVATYEGGKRSQEISVTRKNPRSTNADIILALLTLDLTEKTGKRARFLLLKHL